MHKLVILSKSQYKRKEKKVFGQLLKMKQIQAIFVVALILSVMAAPQGSKSKNIYLILKSLNVISEELICSSHCIFWITLTAHVSS